MKKVIGILIVLSTIIGMGTSINSVYAASVTSNRMSVCSRQMSFNGCEISRSTTINIPITGKYDVVGNVGRGTHDRECQAHEDFDLYIDGKYYVSNLDDDSCEPGTSNIYKNHNFPQITLSAGTHTIRMIHRWWNKSVSTAESVSVAVTFSSVAPPPLPINGVCGSSNGKTVDAKPTSGLCSVGSASSVSGSGPWSWRCAGSNGGSSASCSAQITAAPICGSSNGKTFDTKPTTGLCSIGSNSAIGGAGPWNWTCTSGARRVSCSAQITAAPICGSSNGKTFSAKPTSGLCSVGSTSSISGKGPWDWTCTSGARFVACNAKYAKTAIQINKTNKDGGDSQTIDEGADATFEITVTNVGEENLQNVIITDEAAQNCGRSANETRDMYEGNLFDPNESFTYICIDENVSSGYTNIAEAMATATTSTIVVTDRDDSLVSIKDKIAPNCGSSNGKTVDAKPTSGLCSVGSASSVSGNGPWSWTCQNDGQTVNCSAQKEINAPNCGSSNGKTFSVKPTSGLCSVGSASSVSGNGPWSWTCQNDDKTANCSAQVTSSPEPEPEPEPEKEEKDGAIGNTIWNDTNKNCIQDPGEEPITGVKLKLYNGNKVKTDKTNTQGRYKFKGLKKGTYKVVVAQETLPTGCYQVCDPDGTKMDGKTKVKIKGDEYHRKADFGYYCQNDAPVVAQTSPTTGPGAVAGTMSFILAALSAGYVHKKHARDTK